ncbi:MAG: PD-(D/E)XK nuclease family protein [Anaerolineales bacterium]|nr:PD-(D/E)XK nuclease family protein [Anaerolineales bacterium]
MRELPAISASFTFSQSSLQDYSDCPRRFWLRYGERLQWPAVESEPTLENERRQQEGQHFHRLVQQHRLGLPAEKLARFASTANLSRWWENYLGDDFGITGYAQYAELSLSAPVAGHRLLAKYDLAAIQTGEKALIFDWKTYHKRPRDEWMAVRWQTRVYRLLLVMAGAHLNGGIPLAPEQVEMIYWYADFPTRPARFPYTVAQYQRDLEAVKQLVIEISTTRMDFPMTDETTRCAYCTYRSYCERGAAAGQGDNLEAELQEYDFDFEQVQEIAF